MPRTRLLLAIACLGATPALVAAALGFGHDPRRAEAARPLHARDKDYVGASDCRACHPDHHASWRRTYHASMTQLPDRASVLGRFDGQPVTAFGASATPFERDGHFYMRLPDGEREAEVALCVGSRRYQQYFERTEDEGGITYRRLPLLWHVGEARWMHLNGVFLEADSNDWDAHRAVWNANCIFCHNTGPAPGLTPREGGDKRLDSHVADLGIACESCHGPGRDHARRNASLFERYRAQVTSAPADDIVDPPRLGQAESAALCGQCHSQRLPDPLDKLWTFLDTGPTFRPGGRLDGHVKPVTRDTPSGDPARPNAFRDRFWGDGTARLTAYEYLGVTQSPCFAGGRFTCTSCHTMHGGDVAGQLTAEMRGDRACTQCHAEIARDVAAHTHHPPASSGSRCLDCHMPRIVYGILSIHRSHRVESPDVARDVEAGRPNACTACHLDRTAAWAAARAREFWGARHAEPGARPGGAPADLPEALASLHAGDPVQRAVYVAALGREDAAVPAAGRGFMLAGALVALGDPYGAVRTLARRSALALDRQLGLDLQEALRAFDPQGARDPRNRDMAALVRRFEAAARGRLAPPPAPGLLVAGDYRLDAATIRALLARQAQSEIAIGE